MTLTVSDSGPGIPADLQASVWQRGVHGSDGGQGYGLALVREVIAAHGGSAELRGGPGTSIALTLPLAS